jgi:hypothetical protein
MKRIGIGAVLVVLLLVGCAYAYLQQPQFHVYVPEYQNPPEQFIRAEQGWTDGRSTAALSSYCAGSAACTLRLVHGIGTAMLVAIPV